MRNNPFRGALLAVALVLSLLAIPSLSWAGSHTNAIDLTRVENTNTLSHFELVPAAHADVVASPSPAVAPSPAATLAPPVDANGAVSTAVALYNAIKGGQLSLAVALGLMLLIYGARVVLKLDSHIPAAALPWISAVIGVLGVFGANLAAGQSWLSALLSGLTIGASASGLWSLLGGVLPVPAQPSSTS